MRTLVLWDIDHTLLTPGGIGHEIYGAVFRRLVGRDPEHRMEMSGRTDRAITASMLTAHRIEPTPQLVQAFTDALAAGFAERQSEIGRRGQVLSGARAALAALASRTDVVQSVLTGNMRPIALCKLSAFGLDGFVDLDVGAYGLDGLERPTLVGLARERAAAKYGEPFGASATVLVGDTPYDVDAGHRGGARVVAVATGHSDEGALRAAGAESVLPDLSDTGLVVRAVLRSPDHLP